MNDLFICSDCEQLVSTAEGELCRICAEWREGKLAEMDAEYRDRQERLRRLRMKPEERFAEELADLAKVGLKR